MKKRKTRAAPKRWNVIENLRNIEVEVRGPGRILSADDDRKKSLQEFWLCWAGKKCHVLTGQRGKIILEDFAKALNAQKYVPRLEGGKIYMELTAAQKLKLAQDHSPLLPFAS